LPCRNNDDVVVDIIRCSTVLIPQSSMRSDSDSISEDDEQSHNCCSSLRPISRNRRKNKTTRRRHILTTCLVNSTSLNLPYGHVLIRTRSCVFASCATTVRCIHSSKTTDIELISLFLEFMLTICTRKTPDAIIPPAVFVKIDTCDLQRQLTYA